MYNYHCHIGEIYLIVIIFQIHIVLMLLYLQMHY